MVEVGVVMALVGAALLVVEAHVPAGFVGAVGTVVLAGGAALAIAGAGGGLGLVLAALLAAGAVAGVWLTVVTRKALGTRRSTRRVGPRGAQRPSGSGAQLERRGRAGLRRRRSLACA